MITLPVVGGGSYDLDPRKIIAAGLNYLDHIAESLSYDHRKLNLPTEPVLFAKTPNVLLAPEKELLIPAYLFDLGFEDPRVDHEAELAVIIGKTCRRVSEDTAFDYVFGYTCFNDVTQRNMQKTDPSGWFRGKSLDGFGPIGPVIVPVSAFVDPQNVDILCRVNGELRQHSNTSKMIFPIPRLLSYISKHITLLPGDIVLTGTPEGISPLHDGDVVEVEIQNIGILKTPVRREKSEPKGGGS